MKWQRSITSTKNSSSSSKRKAIPNPDVESRVTVTRRSSRNNHKVHEANQPFTKDEAGEENMDSMSDDDCDDDLQMIGTPSSDKSSHKRKRKDRASPILSSSSTKEEEYKSCPACGEKFVCSMNQINLHYAACLLGDPLPNLPKWNDKSKVSTVSKNHTK